MRFIFFDTHPFEQQVFDAENKFHQIDYVDIKLNSQTAGIANGYRVVCSFANDRVDAATLEILKQGGTELVALRSAGFNHVDLAAAKRLGIRVVRVPKYSPYSVAEHAMCLLLSLNRKIHRAFQRVRELNFSLTGLVGFDLNGKTVGVIGTGKIGSVFTKIANGFGCEVLAYDLKEDSSLTNIKYVSLEYLLKNSDIISLHVPLTTETHHLIDEKAFAQMKPGVFLINTSRGALIDAKALIKNLKTGKVGAAGLDVYEEEEDVFFKDLSGQILQDDILARLLTFPNVLITSHQGFLTREALTNIARTTLENISDFEHGLSLANEVGSS